MRKYYWPLTCLIFCCFLATNLPAQLSKSAYLNAELSIDKRVSDLVSKMTLEEKVGQLRYDA